MNVRLVRFAAGVVAAATVSVMSAGVANAATLDRLDSRIASQVATATAQDTHTAGEYLRQVHDYLEAANRAGDVGAVEAAVKHLRPVLAVVAKAPAERAALEMTDRADVQAAQIERDLPGLTLLAPVTGLVTSLLMTVLDLVASLLGGLPVPLPLPLPELPLPEIPGVPLPELPDAPAPDAPEAPAPEVPEAPVPDVPLPDAPLPDVPLP